MKYNKGTFITVPSRDVLRGLHPTAQAIYMWLCSYANETDNCYPSRATLAKDARCSDRTVDEMLELLLEKGLIKKKGRKEGERQLSNLYTVMIVERGEGGSLPPSRTFATPAKEVRTNSNQLTQTNEIGASEDGLRVVEVAFQVEEETRVKKPPKYPNARTAFSWLPNRQKSWEGNTTQLSCGELLFKRGEEAVKSFVRYVKSHEDDDGFDWIFVQPSDYERKWETIKAYAKRNG